MFFRDSSGDEQQPPKKKKKKCRISKCCKKKDDTDDESDSDDTKKLLPSKPPREEGEIGRQNRKPNQTDDSDYYSSGHSTDYSYTYQDSKDITTPSSQPSQSTFVDVERQYRHEYASMDSFRDTDEENDVRRVSGSRDKAVEAWSGSSSTSIITKPRNIETKQPKKEAARRLKVPVFLLGKTDTPRNPKKESPFEMASAKEKTPLLSSNDPLSSTDDERNTLTVFDSDSSVDSEIQQNRTLLVPKLDLSSLETQTEPEVIHNRPGKEQRFKNIKYEVVKETPTTSSRTTITSQSGSGRSDRDIVDVPVYPQYLKASTKMSSNANGGTYSKSARSKTGKGGGKQRAYMRYKPISKRKQGKRPNKFMKFLSKIFHRVSNNKNVNFACVKN